MNKINRIVPERSEPELTFFFLERSIINVVQITCDDTFVGFSNFLHNFLRNSAKDMTLIFVLIDSKLNSAIDRS